MNLEASTDQLHEVSADEMIVTECDTAESTLCLAVSLIIGAPDFDMDIETDEEVARAVRAASKYAAYRFDEMLKWETEYDSKTSPSSD